MPVKRPNKRSNIKVVISKIFIVVVALAALVAGSTALNDQPRPLVQISEYALVSLPDTSALSR
jgi:hypothetical protein